MFGIYRTEERMPAGGKYRAYLNQMNGIERQDGRRETENKKETLFGVRFMLAVFLFSGYLFLGTEYKQEISRHIAADYTKNVFDFITELAYTLNYETTSFK